MGERWDGAVGGAFDVAGGGAVLHQVVDAEVGGGVNGLKGVEVGLEHTNRLRDLVLVILLGRAELPAHLLLVLLWRNDADARCGQVKEVVERCVPLLAAAAKDAVRLCEDGPADVLDGVA